MDTFKVCGSCGKIASSFFATYCGKCGGELVEKEFPVCKRCGKTLVFPSKFCESCGAKIEEAPKEQDI